MPLVQVPSQPLVLLSVPLCGSPGPSSLNTPHRLITFVEQLTGTHRSWCLRPGALCISVLSRYRLDLLHSAKSHHSCSAPWDNGGFTSDPLKPNLPSGPARTAQMFLDRVWSAQPPRTFHPSPPMYENLFETRSSPKHPEPTVLFHQGCEHVC